MAQNENVPLTPDAMIAQLRAMRQQIPDYSQISNKEKQLLVTASGVPPDMVTSAANALGESATAQTIVGATAEELRQNTADAEVWAAVEAELAATLRGVRTANLIRRHRIGKIVLTTYAVGRALTRKPEHADLLPHVNDMRRANRIGRTLNKPDDKPAPSRETTMIE